MNAQMVWGISKWRDWQSCPAMFKAKHIDKTWIDTPSPAMERGRQVHQAFEEGVKYDITFAEGDELAAWEPVRATFVGMKAQGHTVQPEVKLGIDRHYHETDYWRGANLWMRAALDVMIDDGEKILVVDYKTGRFKQEHKEDAELYGAIARHLRQKPTTVQYYYIDAPENSFTLAVPEGKVLARWMGRTNAADACIASGSFDLTPGPQCRWCGAKSCPKNRNESLK